MLGFLVYLLTSLVFFSFKTWTLNPMKVSPSHKVVTRWWRVLCEDGSVQRGRNRKTRMKIYENIFPQLIMQFTAKDRCDNIRAEAHTQHNTYRKLIPSVFIDGWKSRKFLLEPQSCSQSMKMNVKLWVWLSSTCAQEGNLQHLRRSRDTIPIILQDSSVIKHKSRLIFKVIFKTNAHFAETNNAVTICFKEPLIIFWSMVNAFPVVF